MNKKGQASAVAFMLAVVIVILALAFAFPVNDITSKTMNKTNEFGEVGGLDCSNSSISDSQKAACWTVDIGQAYFIGGMIALAGVVIAAKVIWG